MELLIKDSCSQCSLPDCVLEARTSRHCIMCGCRVTPYKRLILHTLLLCVDVVITAYKRLVRHTLVLYVDVVITAYKRLVLHTLVLCLNVVITA